jgi:RNA polymerase sigma factor (sigma-70 family)
VGRAGIGEGRAAVKRRSIEEEMPELTPEEEKLAADHPGVTEGAVAAVFATHRPSLSREESTQVARLAVRRSTKSYDARKGSFERWARIVAIGAILDADRVEHRYAKEVRAMRRVALQRLADAGYAEKPAETVEEMARRDEAAPARLAQRRVSMADDLVAATLGTNPETQLRRARAAQGVRKLVGELGQTEKQVLAWELQGTSLEAIAKELGMEYRKFLRKHGRLKDRIRAGLAFYEIKSAAEGLDLDVMAVFAEVLGVSADPRQGDERG